jgi:hypothetical protein
VNAVQRGLGGVVEEVDYDNTEALQEPALLVQRLGFERSFSSWSGANAPSPPGPVLALLLLLVRCRCSFSSWSSAGNDGFKQRLGLGQRRRAREEMGGRRIRLGDKAVFPLSVNYAWRILCYMRHAYLTLSQIVRAPTLIQDSVTSSVVGFSAASGGIQGSNPAGCPHTFF